MVRKRDSGGGEGGREGKSEAIGEGKERKERKEGGVWKK